MTPAEMKRALEVTPCQCTYEVGDSCCDRHCIDPEIEHDSEECPDTAKHKERAFRALRIREAERAVLEAAERWAMAKHAWAAAVRSGAEAFALSSQAEALAVALFKAVEELRRLREARGEGGKT